MLGLRTENPAEGLRVYAHANPQKEGGGGGK